MDTTTALRVQPLKYPLSARALDKWARSDLSCAADANGGRHYQFRFLGSTCTDGGSAFHANFHVVLSPSPQGAVIEAAWIDLPLDDGNPGAAQMCVFQTQRDLFLAELSRPPAFCGGTLEAAIERQVELDYAGCLCFDQMLNHKWRNVLCTIHYALASEQRT